MRVLGWVCLAVVATPTSAWAGGGWAGFVDASDELQTDTFPFAGASGDPLYPFGNENYYDGDFADIDGDGTPDRVLGARYGLLLNTGGGLMTPFAGRTGFLFRGMPGASGWGEDAFQTADVDNDNDYDVFSGGNVEPFVLQINQAGRFYTQWNQGGTQASAILIVLTDLENDGDVDLVMGDGGFALSFSIWVNDGNGNYSEESAARGLDLTGNGLMGVTSGDLDADGDYDLLVLPAEAFATGPEKIFQVAMNDGTGNFTVTNTFPFAEGYTDCCTGIGTFGQSMNLGDIDDDGDLDLVAARGPWFNQGSHPDVSPSIFINDGTGDFVDDSANRWDVPNGYDPSDDYGQGKIGGGDGKLVDLDYDGDLDFIVHAKADGQVGIFLNDGTGVFAFEGDLSVSYPPPPDGLGGDIDMTDLDGDGDVDAWIGVAGGQIRILLNQHDELPADVPGNVDAQVAGDAIEVSFEAPTFASAARYYRVYRATTSSLEDRDRRLVKIIGERHQDETFFAPITRHTTTAYLGDSDVELNAGDVTWTDTDVEPGVSYFYTVTHVGPENDESVHSDEAVAMVPAGGGGAGGPTVDIVSPTDQVWGAHPRIVVHYSDPDGVDEDTLHVSFDQDLGARSAGEDLSDLAYRLDGGVAIIPILPPLALPDATLATLTVEVEDSGGALGSSTAQMFVSTVSPSPPTADLAAAPLAGDAPLTVDFDGTDSTDGDGKVYRWEWYFGDGTTAIGRQVSHTYLAGGTYTAMLVVTDNDGGVDVLTEDVDVTGPPPECDLGDSQPCYTGDDGTEDVGLCVGGTQYCVDLFWGDCEGEVTPATEVCDDGEDNDCDGDIDDIDTDCGGPGGDTGGNDTSAEGGDASSGGVTATAGDTVTAGDTDTDGEGGATDDAAGCGCRSTAPPTGAALMLLALATLRRRRD